MPVNMSMTPVVTWSNFCSARGVAPVKASTVWLAIHSPMAGGCMNGAVSVVGMNSPKRPARKTGVQVVMATGKAACTKARPTRAGFITL
jgi:hypothetical protein